MNQVAERKPVDLLELQRQYGDDQRGYLAHEGHLILKGLVSKPLTELHEEAIRREDDELRKAMSIDINNVTF